MTLTVGLTGGIGCGKSTVARLFGELGAGIIDTDAISHELTRSGGAAIPAIRATFGDDYIESDGTLNRASLRALVFSDPASRLRLERLLHPLILGQASAQVKQLQESPYVIVVVPLLLQSPPFLELTQRVLVVDCDERTQIERVMRRSGMTEAEVRAIIASQTPRSERLQRADDIIHNDGEPDDLKKQVAELHRRYGKNSN